uniref:DUF5641 domain-containing protein n=1 Tax=Syphacia muris TaxID=451379 RepID=A0A0N5ABX0_9BILA
MLKKWTLGDVILDRKATLRSEIKANHLFTDASKTAFGIVIYGISENNGKRRGRLLFAKSRLLPLKSSHTIPRAELVAAWLGVKVLQFVRRPSALLVDRLEMCNELAQKNSVEEVQALNFNFRYIPSEENPADLGSRGVPVQELINSKLWWEGPKWLIEEGHWPIQEIQKESLGFQCNKSVVSHGQNRRDQAQKEITERIWNLYPDQNGILRIKDRLQQIGLDNQLIYLPKEHRIILTLVLDAHEKCCHLGTAATLTKFRTEFWIEHGPTTVRKIIECRREITRGFALPGMAPLPSSPVTDISTKVVQDLSTKEFMNAFKRFCARRGTPVRLLSDNGTQSIGAAKWLKTDWEFITPNAPWKGGVYELMKGISNQEIPIPIANDFIELGPYLIKRIERSEECLKEFRAIWHKDYIQFLRERSQNDHHHQKKSLIFREPILGEVIIIEAPNTPRAKWRLATIEKLFRNQNGQITDAEVRVPNTNSDTKSMKRSISKLYPLEIDQPKVTDQSPMGDINFEMEEPQIELANIANFKKKNSSVFRSAKNLINQITEGKKIIVIVRQ